jgi:hypothetical protein
MVMGPLSSGFVFVFHVVYFFYCLLWLVQEAMGQYGPLFVLLVLLVVEWLTIPFKRKFIVVALNTWIKSYEHVTRRVNEALQKDENRSHLAVEFHSSDLPGRDKANSRRYQFVVKRDHLTPTSKSD